MNNKNNWLPMHTMSILALVCAVIGGCSTANDNAPQVGPDGKHPVDWVETHFVSFLNDRSQCAVCHGSYTDAAASGGIANVSCFSASRGAQTCHANGPAGHPAGWEAFSQHGVTAKAAPGAASGYAYCSRCHGNTFGGNGTARACTFCHPHSLAPHPDTPWHGTTASGTNHVTTAEGNAPECAKCHRDGINLTSLPAPPLQPPTTPAGCFNNTLCHGSNVGHPAGWSAPTSHGQSAKAAVNASSGFGYCRTCHGTDYRGSGSASSCFSCHTTAPHSQADWRTGTYSHTATDQTNAQFCIGCHLNNQRLTTPQAVPIGTSPGCYNGTMCHAAATAPHAIGGTYLPATAHGPDAKANLASCQPCHATPASGSNPRFTIAKTNMATGCETCHVAFSAHPVPWLIGRGTTPNTTTHRTAGSLTTACALCHGVNLTGGTNAPSCLSAPISGITCHVSNPAVAQSGCTSCHGSPPTGISSPNRAGSHVEHTPFFATAAIACLACHNGHGSDTVSHANGIRNVTLTATYQDKDGGTSAFTGTTGTCANISCHGGQTTPSWYETNAANLISVDTQCTKCHTSGTTQYIGYHTGEHTKHINDGIACTACHDTTALRIGHFSNLATPAFEQHPRATLILKDGTTVRTATYNATTHVYTCNFTCHGKNHGNETWTGSP